MWNVLRWNFVVKCMICIQRYKIEDRSLSLWYFRTQKAASRGWGQTREAEILASWWGRNRRNWLKRSPWGPNFHFGRAWLMLYTLIWCYWWYNTYDRTIHVISHTHLFNNIWRTFQVSIQHLTKTPHRHGHHFMSFSSHNPYSSNHSSHSLHYARFRHLHLPILQSQFNDIFTVSPWHLDDHQHSTIQHQPVTHRVILVKAQQSNTTTAAAKQSSTISTIALGPDQLTLSVGTVPN